MLQLSNMYHANVRGRKLRIADFISQAEGRNGGQNFPQSMLEELFANVVTVSLSFRGSLDGYQDEVRHGWLLHKTVNDKSWKKYWALLLERGDLYLLPEDGSKSTHQDVYELREAELRPTKSDKYF